MAVDGDGYVTLPLTQAFPTVRALHQMDRPPIMADGLFPPWTTVGFLRFTTANGAPKSVTTVSVQTPPALHTVDLFRAPDQPDGTLWQLRMYGGVAGTVYPLQLLVDELFVVILSLVMHKPVVGKPAFINFIEVVVDGVGYTLVDEAHETLYSEVPLP